MDFHLFVISGLSYIVIIFAGKNIPEGAAPVPIAAPVFPTPKPNPPAVDVEVLPSCKPPLPTADCVVGVPKDKPPPVEPAGVPNEKPVLYEGAISTLLPSNISPI